MLFLNPYRRKIDNYQISSQYVLLSYNYYQKVLLCTNMVSNEILVYKLSNRYKLNVLNGSKRLPESYILPLPLQKCRKISIFFINDYFELYFNYFHIEPVKYFKCIKLVQISSYVMQIKAKGLEKWESLNFPDRIYFKQK